VVLRKALATNMGRHIRSPWARDTGRCSAGIGVWLDGVGQAVTVSSASRPLVLETFPSVPPRRFMVDTERYRKARNAATNTV